MVGSEDKSMASTELSVLAADQNDTVSNQINASNWKKTTTLFLAGQAISLFGSSLVQYAVVWYITLSTRSGPMLTIATLSGFVPQILISLFAGVWADRYSRKLLIIAADTLIALSTLILAVLILMGYRETWLLFLVLGIRAIGTGIQTPAVGAVIPQIVPQDKLARVNGLNGSIQSAIMLLSPAASGALLTLSTLESVLFVDVATAILAISIMTTLQIPMHRRTLDSHQTSQVEDLKAGILYASRHNFVRSLLLFYTLCFTLLAPVVFLTPLMIARTFGDEVWRLTANEVVYFAGSILGGIAFSVWNGFNNRIYTFAVACASFGVFTAALGLSGTFFVYLSIMFILGIHMPFYSNPVIVLLQEKVDQGLLGRMFSLIQIVGSATLPLGMLVFGPLADVAGVEILLVTTGISITLLGLSVFYNKGLRSAA